MAKSPDDECMEELEAEITSLKAQLNQAGVELSQCILDKMEQAKQLAECKKDVDRMNFVGTVAGLFDEKIVIAAVYDPGLLVYVARAQKEEA